MEPITPKIANILDDSVGRQRFTTTICRWQSFARFIMKPVMSAFARDITFGFDGADLLPQKTYIVVSNHQSQLDAFVLLASLNPMVFRRLEPFRAMTTNRFLARGPVKYAARRMGCYPAKPHPSLPWGIEYASVLIKRGQTIYICPEGKKSQPGQQAARPGVALLAKLPNVELIPAHIQWTRYSRWRRSFRLTYGKPFNGSHMSAQEILDACYALPLG